MHAVFINITMLLLFCYRSVPRLERQRPW